LDIEPNFEALMAALKSGVSGGVISTLKFPLERTRYYRNRCGSCKESFDGKLCPRCGRPLVTGSRDRLEVIANRELPQFGVFVPPFCELLPLAYLLADLLQVGTDTKIVKNFYSRMTQDLGHEHFILTEATYEDILRNSTPQIARAIVEQRTRTPLAQRSAPVEEKPLVETQISLGLN
jgi:PHP family Zn ribbon phosphoesterase